MEHPLENPSLTPIGFVLPRYAKRILDDLGPDRINADPVMAQHWANCNNLNNAQPQPAKQILHEILPSLTNLPTPEQSFLFDGLPYFSRDIALLSTVVQWLSTSEGNEFYTRNISYTKGFHSEREFILKFDTEARREQYLEMWVHVCSDKCGESTWSCVPNYRAITERDQIVLRALLWWLGKQEGRQFMKGYHKKIKRLCEIHRQRSLATVRSAA